MLNTSMNVSPQRLAFRAFPKPPCDWDDVQPRTPKEDSQVKTGQANQPTLPKFDPQAFKAQLQELVEKIKAGAIDFKPLGNHEIEPTEGTIEEITTPSGGKIGFVDHHTPVGTLDLRFDAGGNLIKQEDKE